MRKVLLLFFILVMFTGCREKDPLTFVFLGGITGKHSDLGHQGKKGYQLAVNQINLEGGLNGRRIQSYIFDDKSTEEGLKAAMNEIASLNPDVIIGPMTSSQTTLAKEFGLELISPTASSSHLVGLDDNLVRMVTDNTFEASLLGQEALKDGASVITVIMDKDNEIYVKGFEEYFSKEFLTKNRNRIYTLLYSSSKTESFKDLIETVMPDTEAFLFISSAEDTALLTQLSKERFPDSLIYSSGWANTPSELLSMGGAAVEGLKMVSRHSCNKTYPEYEKFASEYQRIYEELPANPAEFSYEAVMTACSALKLMDTKESCFGKSVNTVIIQEGEFQGLQGNIRFNKTGDPVRPLCVLQVQSGKISPLKIAESD